MIQLSRAQHVDVDSSSGRGTGFGTYHIYIYIYIQIRNVRAESVLQAKGGLGDTSSPYYNAGQGWGRVACVRRRTPPARQQRAAMCLTKEDMKHLLTQSCVLPTLLSCTSPNPLNFVPGPKHSMMHSA